MASAADEWIAAAEATVRTHRPVEGGPVICPKCTERGVGGSAEPVAWPCAPYTSSLALLKRHGRPVPLPVDEKEEPNA